MAANEQCGDCGAILHAGYEGCPECSPEAMADKFETQQEIDEREGVEVSDRTKRRRAAGDPYKAMEDLVRNLKSRSNWLRKKLAYYQGMLTEPDELPPSDHKDIATAQKTYAEENHRLASAAAKCASEMAKIMALKSRMVDQLTREEQLAQIVRWARSLPLPKIEFLISMLEQVYNDEKALRTSRKAARRSAGGIRAVK